MRPARLTLATVLLALSLALLWALRPGEDAPPAADAPAAATDSASAASETARPAAPGPRTREAFAPEEVFRRAFWRHPAPEDLLVRAARVETLDAAGEVRGWRWFLAVHPGSGLLAALRAPDTFGLRRLAPAPSAPVAPLAIEDAPDWFPAPADPASWEVLQAPGGGLTVIYRASDNLLYATDRGGGFSPPARPL